MTPSIDLPSAWLQPDWATRPDATVKACMTVRGGGVSQGPWAGFNLGDHVGDRPADVAANRAAFARALGVPPVFLRQVHGTRVVWLSAADALPGAPTHEADACVTTAPQLACCVLVADCLPVLLRAPGGRGVAAAHAGWRGLAAGVVEAAVAALCDASACAPHELVAWLGACIGPDRFEVGADVRAACAMGPGETADRRFVPAMPRGAQSKWHADLPALAADRLRALGLTSISGGAWCTASDASRFFSFRRDGVTGRMAAAVWITQAGIA